MRWMDARRLARRRRGIIAAASLLICGPALAADPIAGDWQGVMTRSGVPMAVRFHFATSPSLHGDFTSLTQRAIEVPLDEVMTTGAAVRFGLGGDTAFEGQVTPGGLSGTFKDDQGGGTFALHRASPPAYPYRITTVSFRNGSVTLAGTLLEPVSAGRHAAVVLLQGSGPEVRWGTNRYIADRFARAGIAALIYDKRGSGASGGDWKTADFDDLARDALAGVDLLAHRPGIDVHRIGLHGHSQGGIVAPDAARLAPGRIAFIVAEDTVSGPVWRQDLYRVRNALAPDLPPDQLDAAMRLYGLFVDVARGVEPMSKLEAAEAAARGKPWLDALGLPAPDAWIWPWYRRTGPVDTLDYWRAVKAPTLLAYGERDALAPVGESIRSIGAVLDGNGAPYTAIVVPAAEHNLTIRPQPGQPFFWWHAAPGYYDLVAAWIRNLGPSAGARAMPMR